MAMHPLVPDVLKYKLEMCNSSDQIAPAELCQNKLNDVRHLAGHPIIF